MAALGKSAASTGALGAAYAVSSAVGPLLGKVFMDNAKLVSAYCVRS